MASFVLAAAAVQAKVETIAVDGLQRTYTVYAPSQPGTGKPPLVFGFHGHGGNMRNAARSFRMHQEMPEAVVVYMQGLPTPTPNDPEGRRNGWQIRAGGSGDRDLKFFDAVFAVVAPAYGVDKSRVFAMGHSNGGRFTYLLWAERGGAFRAFGPSGAPWHGNGLEPKPFFHVAGEKDPLVSFLGQRTSVQRQMARQGCPKEPAKTDGWLKTYPGKDGNDVLTYFHPGGHEFPREVPGLLATFFRGR